MVRSLMVRILVVLSVVAMSSDVSAQVLFRGKPAPDCSAFFITEVGGGMTLTPSVRGLFTAEHGIMFNLDERYALGGTLYYVAYRDLTGSGLGLKARGRRWLDPNWGLDIGTGVVDLSKPGLAGSAGISYRDLVVFSVGLDVPRHRDDAGKHRAILHAEIKGGSYVGAGAYGAIIAGLLTVVVIFIAAGGAGD